MFSSFFNSAKEILENATSEQPSNTPQAKPQPPPQQPVTPAKQETGGGDLLGGILQAVGKTLTESNQQGQQSHQQNQPAPPAAANNEGQPEKPGQGFNLKPEDVALISKGLGILAQTIQEKVSAKDVDEGQIGKVGTNDGKTQMSSMGGHGNAEKTTEQGGDFLSSLMNMAKELGKANSEAPQGASQTTPHLSPEDIAKITAGLGSLVGAIKEKTFGDNVEDEAVTKLDSQGGKVQVSSMVDKKDAAQPAPAASSGGDFLTGLMSMAKDVGKVLGEQNQTVADTSSSAASKNTQGGAQLSQEDIAKITAGLSSLVETIKEKTFKKDAVEEVTKLDSQGGKVQVSSVVDKDTNMEQKVNSMPQNTEQPAAGGDFLSGLLSVAKDVGKAIGEQNQSGTTANTSSNQGSETKTQGVQLSQDDIAKLTAGIGSLVGTIQGKANDMFQKKSPAEEENKPKEEPIIDDVEGEIGKVVLPGYTGYTGDNSTLSKAKTG